MEVKSSQFFHTLFEPRGSTLCRTRMILWKLYIYDCVFWNLFKRESPWIKCLAIGNEMHSALCSQKALCINCVYEYLSAWLYIYIKVSFSPELISQNTLSSFYSNQCTQLWCSYVMSEKQKQGGGLLSCVRAWVGKEGCWVTLSLPVSNALAFSLSFMA